MKGSWNNKQMENQSPVKMIEKKEDVKIKKNQESPNPYVRRWGSHIKSHFSQSQCEFFESSGDEQQPTLTINNNNVNSLKHLEDKRTEGRVSLDAPVASLDLTEENQRTQTKSSLMVKNQLLLSATKMQEDQNDKPLQRKNSLEMELEEMDEQERDDDEDAKSALIIRSHRSNDSEEEIDSDFEGLIEPGAEIIPKFFPVPKTPKEKESEQAKKIITESNEQDKTDSSTAGEESHLENKEKSDNPQQEELTDNQDQ